MAKPTVNDQILALFGVRDVLMMMAREEINAQVPNHYYLFDYLGKSIDLAATALHQTVSEPKSDLAHAGSSSVFEGSGFAEPDDGVAAVRDAPSNSITISN